VKTVERREGGTPNGGGKPERGYWAVNAKKGKSLEQLNIFFFVLSMHETDANN
jgi:hypothetical protein